MVSQTYSIVGQFKLLLLKFEQAANGSTSKVHAKYDMVNESVLAVMIISQIFSVGCDRQIALSKQSSYLCYHHDAATNPQYLIHYYVGHPY